MPATVFDANKKTNQTIGGGGLTATSTGAGAAVSNRPAQANFYAEFTPTTVTGTPQLGIGTQTTVTTTSLQALTSALGYDPSGAVKYNGTTLATIAAWVVNNRIDMAVNLQYKLIWFRVAGGNWNNNALNDPATLTGGIDFSGMTLMGTFLAFVYASLTGTVWSAVYSAASWAGVAPVGYGALDVTNANIEGAEGDYRIFSPVLPDYSFIVKGEPAFDTRIFKQFSPAGAIKTVSGLVKENGILVQGRVVEVYDRITGELIGRTTSAADGSWSLPTLGRPAVRVVGSDPTAYNSLVFDNVLPI